MHTHTTRVSLSGDVDRFYTVHSLIQLLAKFDQNLSATFKIIVKTSYSVILSFVSVSVDI